MMTRKRDGVTKACPFCGGRDVKISIVQGGHRGLRQGIAHCNECGAEVRAFSDLRRDIKGFDSYKAVYDFANRQARERVIRKWDTRAIR